MNTKRALCSALTVMALAFAASVHADDGVTMTRTFKAGDVLRYKWTGEITSLGASITQTVKDEVKEVKPNGDVVIAETIEGATITFGGQDHEMPASPPRTFTRDKFGKLVDFKAPEVAHAQMSPAVQRLTTMLQEAVFSDKPVKSGDTWQIEQDNPVVQGKKIVVKETYNGIDKVNGADQWKVNVTGEVDTDDKGAKMTYDGTIWIDPTNGHMAKAEGTMKGLPTQNGPMDISVKFTMLKPGGNGKDKEL